ncbi:succinate--CoA ligase [ADP-forming] subunit beta [Hypericibacter adhaerens]|uniref:Succinate--CoA ligase [ADP-forming] subunit beta n=2 Tax=Hypericibacter adhaerens TaxID=2602016 RepID=A0A5J6N5R0_9PROT|nr:succinate--CoA ligase [ADP-forming] subunit beta [Hypericibacter adhaerens]
MPVANAAALDQALRTLPPHLVLKAQIFGGGRGKGGGIAFAATADEASAAYAALRNRAINGLPVESVLIEERIDHLRERYAGLVIDSGEIRLLFGRAGGVEIEEITARDPGNLAGFAVDPIDGPASGSFADCFDRLGFALEYRGEYEAIGRALFALARSCDATTVEINPLVELPQGRLLALDARVFIDDDALGRQAELAALRPHQAAMSSARSDVAGLRFKDNPAGGTIGLIGLGGGLNVTLMDWIAESGEQVARLVDIDPAIGAGRAAEGFAAALAAFDEDSAIHAVLLNIITCGYRLDEITAALLPALAARNGKAKPVILHLRGNAGARTPAMLAHAGCLNSASIAAAVADVIAAARA